MHQKIRLSFWKRAAAFLLTGVTVSGFVACSSDSKPESSQTIVEETKMVAEPTLFDTYVSNTVIATGNNTIIKSADSVTYRAWLPVEVSGEFDYCFYFSNTVDSTYDDGSVSYVGMSGGSYTIESASISDGGTEFDANIDPETTVSITFLGETSKEVLPDETFWSDPVSFDVPEGHYLLWEWTISGENIPAICMSNLAYSYKDKGDDKGFLYTNEIPLPQLIGVDRKVEARIVTLGDSVTQGCQTTEFEQDFWAAQTLEQLGTDSYSLWNLGLGYSRATDCATDGDWLERAIAGADIVTIAFGTNDIISGAYGEGGSSSAEEIETAVRTITNACTSAGIQTILWNSPPFDLTEELDAIRTEYNARVETIAEDYGAVYFDVASLLADESNASKTVYGQHPDGEGGTVIVNALTPVIQSLMKL